MTMPNPTVGEILDRISILLMKLEEGRTKDQYVVHFGEELHELRMLLAHKLGDADTLASLLVEAAALGAVNGRLWELNKQAVQPVNQPRIVTLYEAHVLNTGRAERVRTLGELSAGATLPSDKVY